MVWSTLPVSKQLPFYRGRVTCISARHSLRNSAGKMFVRVSRGPIVSGTWLPSPALTGSGRGRITIELSGEGHSSLSRAPCHFVFPRRDTASPFVPGRRYVISCPRREKIHRSSVLGTATRCCPCHPCGIIPFGKAAVPRRSSLSGRASSRAGRRFRPVIFTRWFGPRHALPRGFFHIGRRLLAWLSPPAVKKSSGR